MPELILVTGATGYIASRLIPRLLDSGYRVCALARDPYRLSTRSWFNQVDLIQADVMNPESLAHAFDGVDTAYYLIHNMSHGHGYTSLELDGARNFAQAAEQANIQHIIYLGGLADPEQPIAPHIRSRIETGKVLRERKVPVTEFRAGVIVGSGSISFEMIRFMTELLPIVPGPLSMKNKTQPIAIQNIIDYLMAALENTSGQGQIFEIGGPEITIYKDLMLRYAYTRRLKRSMILLPSIPVWFMAFGMELMTPVPYPIAYALIGDLSVDSIVKHPETLEVFPEVQLIDFDTAIKDALEKTHPLHIEHVWDENTLSIKHEGCFIEQREFKINASLENVFHTLEQLANKHDWQIEFKEENSKLLVCDPHQHSGKYWVEWRAAHSSLSGKFANRTYLSQAIFFAPHGLLGFVYWFCIHPFRSWKFRGLIEKICRQGKTS